MGSRRILLLVAVTALAVCVGAPAHSAPPNKKCATVVKKVRGKKRKVKVCPKKVNISLKLDTSHAASVEVTPGGGSTTPDSPGNATLTVPAGATKANVDVRVTPIRSAAHLPLKSFVAGVQLDPDGLQLEQPATLTIRVAKVPKGRLVGFTYSGKGRALHPYPVKRSGNVLTFRIGHFSGYGAGIESDPGRIALVQTMLAEEQSIGASLLAAGPSGLVSSGALYRYQAWMTAALAYPELAPFRQVLRTMAEQAFRAATQQARASCNALHQLGPVFDMFRAIGFARSIGVGDVIDPAAELNLKECLSFELDFDTTITWAADGGQVISHVQAMKVPLDWTNNWSGQLPLDYVSFSFPEPADCSMVLDPHGEAPFMASIPLMGDFQLPVSDSARIATDVDVGQAGETITIACPNAPPTSATPHYYEGIYVFHDFKPTFRIADWSLVGGAVFATRDYNQTFNGGEGTITQATHFVLRHVPR